MDEQDSFRLFDQQTVGALIFYGLACVLVLERMGIL